MEKGGERGSGLEGVGKGGEGVEQEGEGGKGGPVVRDGGKVGGNNGRVGGGCRLFIVSIYVSLYRFFFLRVNA